MTLALALLASRVSDHVRNRLWPSVFCVLLLLGFPLDASAQYREAPRFRRAAAPVTPALWVAPTRGDTILVTLSDSALGIASRRRHMWYGALVGYVAAGIYYTIDADRNGDLAASITGVVVMPPAILLGVMGGAAVHDIRVARARKKVHATRPSPPARASPDAESKDPANAQR